MHVAKTILGRWPPERKNFIFTLCLLLALTSVHYANFTVCKNNNEIGIYSLICHCF